MNRVFQSLICCALLLPLSGSYVEGRPRQHPSTGLFVVVVNDKRGYIDRTGRVVIEPQFQGASDFSEGLAVVAVSDGTYKTGYIDESGRVIIKPQFDAAGDFSDGLAAVGIGTFGLHGTGDHKWGFIDKSGKMVIEPRFRDTGSFSEGLAAVGDEVGNWGYINKAGEVVIPLQFTFASEFSEGLACVMMGNKYGFIDQTGRIAIKPQYSSPSGFSEGLALVRVGGKTVDPSPYAMIIGPLGGKLMYIDKTGKTVIKLAGKVKSAQSFSEGLAGIEVKKKDGYLYWGYIDKSGRVVIEPRFGHADEFSEGLALILLDGKWGYIDKSGNITVQMDFSLAHSFRDGLAWVQAGELGSDNLRDAKYGYIDKTGKVIWQPSK